MEDNEIQNCIKTLGKDAYFVGKADEKVIHFIENELGVILPESYKWFLTAYGLAELPGFEILGNGLAQIPACVDETLQWRKLGLPNSLVVIENEGTDWIHCLDTSRLSDGECPVVDWEQNHGIGKIYFKTFLAFFEEVLKESIKLRDEPD